MVRRVVETTLRFPAVVGLIIGLLALGVPQLRDMAGDELPGYATASVEGQAESLGLSAVEGDQLSTAPVEQHRLDGVPRLDDVSTHRPLISGAVAGVGRGPRLVTERFPDAGIVAVTEDVEEALDDLRPVLDRLSVTTDAHRPATYLQKVHETFSWLLAFCLLLVALALALVRWRLARVALVTAPISLLAATQLMQWRGEDFNQLVLAGSAMVAAVGYAALPRLGLAGRGADERLAT
jgi:Cu/Ag efflux pump CusA